MYLGFLSVLQHGLWPALGVAEGPFLSDEKWAFAEEGQALIAPHSV